MQLYHLLYQSYASEGFTGEELQQLLRQSSLINQAEGVTGLLLYTPDGRFTHLLEGRKQQVLAVYQTLIDDSRNHTCEILMQGPWSRRSFSTWYVGLADCEGIPEDLSMMCLNFGELPELLPGLAPTRPMLVHRLLSFVEPFLPQVS